MFFIYGSREGRTKKIMTDSFVCEECKHSNHEITVFQDYFHIFFIPIFPNKIARIKTKCMHCNYINVNSSRIFDASLTRAPFYLYTGLILCASFICLIIFGLIQAQFQRTEYVNNPKINDVYIVKDKDNENKEQYYFLKVQKVEDTNIYMMHSAYQYSKYVYKMSSSDYFVNDDIFEMKYEDLKLMYKKDVIISVIRDYDKSSQFNVVK